MDYETDWLKDFLIDMLLALGNGIYFSLRITSMKAGSSELVQRLNDVEPWIGFSVIFLAF